MSGEALVLTVQRRRLPPPQLVRLPQRRDLSHEVLNHDALLLRGQVRAVVVLEQVRKTGVLVPAGNDMRGHMNHKAMTSFGL